MAKLLNINRIDNTIGTFVASQSEHLWHFSRNICGVSVGTFVAFRSEHLWCVEVKVATLTQGARVAGGMYVPDEVKLLLVLFRSVL